MRDFAIPDATIPAVVSLIELGNPRSLEGPVRKAPTADMKHPKATKSTLYLESGIRRRKKERTTTTLV